MNKDPLSQVSLPAFAAICFLMIDILTDEKESQYSFDLHFLDG
jgi:hypothetical protein